MYKRLLLIRELMDSRNKEDLEMELNGLAMSEDSRAIEMAELYKKGKTDEARIILDSLLGENQPVPKGDFDLQGLKTAGMLLETRLSVLIHRKAELMRKMNQFRIRYHAEVGSIMAEILQIRREFLFRKAEKNNKFEEDYQQAQKDYDDFHQQHKAETKNKPKFSIDPEQKDILREKFRRASKLCHPDLIAEELREQATELFIRLKNAYMDNDVKTIEDILAILEKSENHLASRTEVVSEESRMKALVEKLRIECEDMEIEIIKLQDTRAYKTILEIDDLENYFDSLKEKFLTELQILKKEYEQTGLTATEE